MRLLEKILYCAAVLATFIGVGLLVLFGIYAFPYVLSWLSNLPPSWQESREFMAVMVVPLVVCVAPFLAIRSAFLVANWLLISGGKSHQKSTNAKTIYSISVVVCVGFAIYVLIHGIYPEHLELKWVEEVRLKNGDMLEVNRRMELKRYDLKIKKYEANAKFHELRFRPSADDSEVHVQTSLTPIYLNNINGKWYLVVAPTDGADDAGQNENWGQSNSEDQRLAVLIGNEFKPLDWQQAPDDIVVNNLISTREVGLDAIDSLPAGRLSWNEKRRLLHKYVSRNFGPDALHITRHYAEKKYMETEYKAAIKSLGAD